MLNQETTKKRKKEAEGAEGVLVSRSSDQRAWERASQLQANKGQGEISLQESERDETRKGKKEVLRG